MVSLLAVITGLCAYLIIKVDMSTLKAVIISFLSWCLGGFLYYKFIVLIKTIQLY